MTRPSGYLIRMLIFLVAVGAVAALLSPVLITAFSNNPGLNSLILFILALGIGWNLNQVLRLRPEVRWLETYQTSRSRLAALPSPKLLAPMASMLAIREGRVHGENRQFTLSATGMRSLLDGIASRLDESRELSRYMTGLLIFLGLLGTFWGLLKTVTSVSDVIGSMTLGNGDMNLMFDQLKTGLARPL
ncbi:MAG: flagellar motor protein MotA, partial [Rhodopila sp.]